MAILARGCSHRPEPDGEAYRSPLPRGLVLATGAETDAAFEHVERAIDERDSLPMYLEVHPVFDGLRADRRYAEMESRMRQPAAL